MIRIEVPRLSEVNTAAALAAQKTLLEATGEGNDCLGWLDLPVCYDRAEFSRILDAAARIRAQSAALVVIGIGGSSLGARAVIELLRSPNYNLLPKDTPDIYFVGNDLSSDSISETVAMLGDRDFSVNVISKSGTTTETAVAFRFFRALLEKKYGKDGAHCRIYATTDSTSGALRAIADSEGYASFSIPGDIGGRYSVLTAVGLLPIAVAGIDIAALMEGAAAQREVCRTPDPDVNPALAYAMHRQGCNKSIEVLGCFEPSFRLMAEWWKHLFGESEGKDGKGIFPASVILTSDLHSMGQYLQQGPRCLQETIVAFDASKTALRVPHDAEDADGLNYLADLSMTEINEKAMLATAKAHSDGGVPVTLLRLERIDEKCCGALIYFFEFACAVSAYMSGVNPFDQPSVEAYKRNMFELLGKPGY